MNICENCKFYKSELFKNINFFDENPECIDCKNKKDKIIILKNLITKKNTRLEIIRWGKGKSIFI